MKEKIMNAKNLDDLVELESEALKKFRDDLYNNLLKDSKIRNHVCDILNVKESEIENALMINDHPPLDDFDE